MNPRWLVLVGISSLLFTGCNRWPWQPASVPVTSPSPQPTLTQEQVKGVQEDLQTKTKQTLPSDAQQTVLRDVSGGNASGIATRKFAANKFEHTILADLPELQAKTFYAAWLVKGQSGQPDFNLISTGKLQPSKGGWLLEFTSTSDWPDHKGVVVTLETKDDQQPEQHILEGSF